MKLKVPATAFLAALIFPSPALAEVKLTKSADRSTAQPGDVITYTITYRNTGSSEVTNFVITDPIPQGTSYVNGSARLNGGTNGVSFDYGRNKLILTVGIVPPGGGGSGTFQTMASWTVTGYEFGTPVFDRGADNRSSYGDTFMPAWSNDGKLYSASCDTFGFDSGCTWPGSPDAGHGIAIHELTGLPGNNTLHGTNIACLREYNAWAALHCGRTPAEGGCPNPIPDWKSLALTSVNGVLYLPVSVTNWTPQYNSIIRSTDRGRTWHIAGGGWAQHNSGMFSAERDSFGPSFVDYGQDSGIQGDPNWPDDAKDYVYAVSRQHHYGPGDLLLGRVLRRNLDRLDRNDWQILTSYTTDGQGNRIPSWGPIGSAPQTILPVPPGYDPWHFGGWPSVHWIAAIHKYVMIRLLSYPCTDPTAPWCFDRWADVRTNSWPVYFADHLWGPWTLVRFSETEQFKTWNPEGLYLAVVPTKFMDPDVQCDGTGCHLTVWVLCAGDFFYQSDQYYHLTWVRMTLNLR